MVNLQRFKLERIKLAVFKKLYCHGTMPGGERKKRSCPETTASGVATRAEVLNTMPTSATTENVAPAATELVATDATELVGTDDTELVGTSSKSTGLAAFTHHMTQATHCFDEVEAERKALRADKAALIVRMKVATKTVKRVKALAGKYYDLCVTSGVDAEVLDAVEEAEEPDEEAEEPDEEMEEPDEEAEDNVVVCASEHEFNELSLALSNPSSLARLP